VFQDLLIILRIIPILKILLRIKFYQNRLGIIPISLQKGREFINSKILALVSGKYIIKFFQIFLIFIRILNLDLSNKIVDYNC